MLTLDSPAKINLFLRILYKRNDNYHEIASLFQAINLYDTLHFQLNAADSLTTTDPTLLTDSSNLILKAANLFRKKTGLNFGLKAHLIKRIPHQAGLGGGSSNAATTLWALNQLTHAQASLQQLSEWGSEIGSDIPFFFSHGTAYCTGRGEQVKDLAATPTTPLWIIKPHENLSTPLVYKNFDPELRSDLPKETLYINDLEPAAFKALPSLENFKKNLLSFGFKTVLLSGSGSAFFCIGNPTFPDSFSPAFCCRTLFLNRKKSNWYEAEKVVADK